MYSVSNDYIRLAVDTEGCLCELVNLKSRRNIVQPHYLLRCILADGECLEFEARPEGLPEIEKDERGVVMNWKFLRGDNGRIYQVLVKLQIELAENKVNWHIALDNQSQDATVRECHYPVLSISDPQPPMSVINSELVSTRIDDVPQFLKASFTDYMAPDQKYIRHSEAYPGRTCSLNCFLLDWGGDGLYYGCHDQEFEMTFHSLEQEKDSINCFMSRLSFLSPRRSWSDHTIVTALYNDGWMRGADIYKKWVNSWYKAPQIPSHIRNMPGWQRVIMHHQYGEYFFKYQDLENIYNEGRKAGIDTIFLFGWTSEGMDAGYPVYTPDETQGGFEEMKKNIIKVREKGGHVILYYNGQLIDAASEYYRTGGGQKVSIKRADGTEHREFYNFSNTGTFLRAFGNKTFAVACPSCREWVDILKKHIDFACEVGADSVFFDQLGLASYPCCDPSHGHPVPYTGLMKGKMEMLKELYEYTKSKNPDMGFGVECTTDQTAQYADFIHIFGNVSQSWDENWRENGTIPRQKSGAYLFKAILRDAVISNRNIRDDSNIEFPVNRMVLLGSRSDVEIYRCRADISATPHYQEYLGKANALREKFADVLYEGNFSNCDYHSVDNPAVQTNSFLLDDDLAVIVTQSSSAQEECVVTVPGFRFVRYDSARGDVVQEGSKFTIPQDGLAVLLYSREND